VVDKIWQKHKVTTEEVEEVIYDDKPISIKGISGSYWVYGQSLSGRYLFIVLRRKGFISSQYKVITAREMQDKEKKFYEKSRK
jgi:uncharacterized DUF497 family protein